MNNSKIVAITMPKWGLSMTEGKVVDWLVNECAEINAGDGLLDVETEKIASAVEANSGGTLRRKLVGKDDVVPVSGLLGVMAPAEVTDKEIDEFVQQFVVEPVDAAEGGETGPEYQFADIDGSRIRYLDLGAGDEILLLIHGFGGDLDNWLFNHEPLSAHCRVIAVDLPGHGQSSKSVGNGTQDSIATLLLNFLDVIGVEKVHVAGHSMGGALAQQLALKAPGKIKSLCLIASAGLGSEINGSYVQGFIDATSIRELRPVVKDLFANASLVNRRMMDDILKYKRLDGVTEALRKISDGFREGDSQTVSLAPRVRELGIRTVVVFGEADRIIPSNHAHAFGDAAETAILPGSGHMVQMEAAQAVNDLIVKSVAKG
jgi:pyruvate dehydrogenase E2 component (dihydrolipoamide acetyltransferase)